MAQANGCGLSEWTVRRKVQSGQWRKLHHRVYIPVDRSVTPQARLRAAALSAGDKAVAYGPSAAWWYGLIDNAPAKQWVTVPERVTPTPRRSVRMRRRDVPARDLTTVRGLRVTGLPISVLEAAVALPDGSSLMDRALQLRTTLPILQAAHQRNLGRTGSPAATRLLATAGSGGRSEAERTFHQLMKQARIFGWTHQFEVNGYVVDSALVDARLLVEIDGWAFHSDSQQRSRDLQRQNALINAGWKVLRFDWHRLTHDPQGVVADVLNAIACETVRSAHG